MMQKLLEPEARRVLERWRIPLSQKFAKKDFEVAAAIMAMEQAGVAKPERMDVPSAVHDLALQWGDHHHMRDQSWKTVTNSAIVFVGVVGLEVAEFNPSGDVRAQVPAIVLVVGYAALIILSTFGLLVTAHHRQRQAEKFQIIMRYEIALGLWNIFGDILRERRKAFYLDTGAFIIACHWMLIALATLLLARWLPGTEMLLAPALDGLGGP